MRFFYTILFYLLTPLIALRLYWKGRKLKSYRERWGERFCGGGKARSTPVDVWLHAVSLGEVIAATPLIESFLKKNLRVCVTTMTPTGSAQVLRQFGERVVHQYLPYDLPHALRRFFKIMAPRVGIIMETELWPNLIFEAARIKLPLFLANARISDKAYAQYSVIRWLFRPILKNFTCIMTQSAVDEMRYKALTGHTTQVKMLGNLKFDLEISPGDIRIALSIKKTLGELRPLLILASTHENEEFLVLEHLPLLQQSVPGIVVLIAPRHPERFQQVYELSMRLGYKTGRRSVLDTIYRDSEVVVLDSMGELMSFYSVVDYAFVGGSLVPVGGHNVLEPIALEVPVFCGPFMHNSRAIIAELLRENALIQVETAQAFITEMSRLHSDPACLSYQVEQARRILKSHQGALARYLEMIEQSL